MFSYYRTLFDIRPHEGDPVGLALMQDVEERLRRWVAESHPGHPDILDAPGDASSGRIWELDGALLRLSGGRLGEQGYFWLRWHVDDSGGDGHRRYLGFRLATEGDSVQADVEIKVENRDAGHFDAEFGEVMDTLLSQYRCSTLDKNLSSRATVVSVDQVDAFWERLTSPERCLPVVVVSEKRGGGIPVDVDTLQRDLMGLAEVAFCSDEAAWMLGWHSWKLLCYDGQLRIYSSALDAEDDEARHPAWSFQDVSQLEYDAFLQLLRDECSHRIYYPEGRDALRVFSRVRGRVREQRRATLSQENRQLFDEWAEEVAAKDAEIDRWKDAYRRLEEDNAELKAQVQRLGGANRHLEWRLYSADERLSAGYEAPVADGEEAPRARVRTVADVMAEAKSWPRVRVFEQAAKDCGPVNRTDAQRFYDVLSALNRCGEERAALSGSLGTSEEDWVRGQGLSFAGRESTATMNQHGTHRLFRDDDGSIVEMQPHISVSRSLRVHVRWSEEETLWLVGYIGWHLPTASG